ncbi:acyl-CoA thioesterase [Anaeromyxobacter paludicola]|uniref:Thioesterase n=1 Tax=Anaeromyxobacter paludicola TaxID=2918171 RepID=A0ABM7XDH9_9BACT|nr:thioesterase family protein [Anaeromyxobacter paludicola]BDG09893.1 thioesterase [Anaeromyxobacter paludicola]
MEGYPVVVEEKVRYSDIDAFNHLNNVVFFQLFQQARVAYFEEVGIFSRMGRGEQNLVVGETSCRFLAEGHYGDVVQCGARFARLGTSSCEQQYRLEVRGKPIAEGSAVLVFYDFQTGRSAPLPEPLKARIREIEARAGRVI